MRTENGVGVIAAASESRRAEIRFVAVAESSPAARAAARAARIEVAQAVERAFDRVAPFHADEDRDLPLRLRAAHVGGGRGEEEAIGMPVDEGMDRLDVLERAGERRAGALRIRRIDPRRHE